MVEALPEGAEVEAGAAEVENQVSREEQRLLS